MTSPLGELDHLQHAGASRTSPLVNGPSWMVFQEIVHPLAHPTAVPTCTPKEEPEVD